MGTCDRCVEVLDGRAYCCVFFFFSSRRRHTRLQGDWSSDVCSSDLGGCAGCPIFSEFMSYFSLYILQEMSIEKQSIKPNEVVIFYLRDSFQEIIYLSQHCLSIS